MPELTASSATPKERETYKRQLAKELLEALLLVWKNAATLERLLKADDLPVVDLAEDIATGIDGEVLPRHAQALVNALENAIGK